MFAKGRRFNEPPPSTVPPPGAYDVPTHSPEAACKKGALGVVKDERFKQGVEANKPDTFGLYGGTEDKENAGGPRKRAVSAMASGGSSQAERERHRQQLEDLRHRLTASHEKEVTKLKAKLERADKAREEAAKDKIESTKEVSGLKSEIRHLTSRLTKTETLLTKHQATLPLLQTKLTDLQSSNDASRARKDAEISTLTTQICDTKTRLSKREAELCNVHAALEREQTARIEQAQIASAVIASTREETRLARLAELRLSEFANARLERQLADRLAQVESLVSYAQGLEAQLQLAEEQRKEQEVDIQRLRSMWAWDRELIVGERGEKEWRQRARADWREVEGLVDRLHEVEGEAKLVGEGWEMGERVWERRRKSWEKERKDLKVELEVAEGELDEAINVEIPRLESALAASETAFTSATEDIAGFEHDIADLQQRLMDETGRLEGELEEQQRISQQKVAEAEKERVEKRRVVGLLAQTRASESALQSENAALTTELDRLSPLLSHTSLQAREIDHLARLSSAAEAESRQLMAENAELVGHKNDQQRIRHVAVLRGELAESRRKHLATTSSLSFAEQRIAALESELSSYRAVPSSSSHLPSSHTSSAMLPPPVPPSRSRVSRPAMHDALSASTPVPAARSNTAASLPSVLVHEPSPSLLSVSAFPPSRTVNFPDDPPLLPPILAKSQPALPSAAAAAGARMQKRTALPTGRVIKKKASSSRLLGEEDAGSTSVRMEGRMSVSELFS
ncbi:hypothetical protein JCM11641_005722 [Rhodosporidiobolus odoratus]